MTEQVQIGADSPLARIEARVREKDFAGALTLVSKHLEDETALIDMLVDPEDARIYIGCTQEDRILLNCALRSTRLMMEQAVAGISTGRPQQY